MSSQKPNDPKQPGNRREQLQQQRREQAAKERKVRNVTYGILGIVLLAIVGVIVFAVFSSSKTPVAEGGGAATGDQTLVIGDAAAPVTVSIYQDYMCPYCGQFERANRDDLKAMVADGSAKVELHLMNFLDPQSQGTKYSSRAANALVAVAKAEPEKVMAFNAALYDNQPEENTAGLTDAQIADLARQAGVSEEVITTFAAMANQDFVTKSNAASFNEGITSTPTVKVNGESWPNKENQGKLYEPGQLKTAVEEAAAKK